MFNIGKRKINILLLMLFVLFFTFACKDSENERSEGNKKEADTDPNPVDITATLPGDFDMDTDEKNANETSESAVVDSSIFVDVIFRKVSIPSQYISCIYKDTYMDKEAVEDFDIIRKINSDINDSEIVELSINDQEIIEQEGDSTAGYSQYPLVLETNCKVDFFRIDLLKQNGNNCFVQLKFVTSADNIKNKGDIDIAESYDGKSYVNCFVESKNLYEDIEELWGKRITAVDLQSPMGIEIFYNSNSPAVEQQNFKSTVKFTLNDAEEFTRLLLEEAVPIYDEHSFGITFDIKMSKDDCIRLYYAEDGCAMFQLDGVSYMLKENGLSAILAKKYIQELEEKVYEKN